MSALDWTFTGATPSCDALLLDFSMDYPADAPFFPDCPRMDIDLGKYPHWKGGKEGMGPIGPNWREPWPTRPDRDDRESC